MDKVLNFIQNGFVNPVHEMTWEAHLPKYLVRFFTDATDMASWSL